MKNAEHFVKELQFINDEELRYFIEEVLNNLPDYFRKIGASTSGTHHPSYTLGEGGLIRHTKAAVGIAVNLFRADIYPFDEFDKDIVVSSLILHDGLKCGMWEDKTAFVHPILMKNLLLELFNDDEHCELGKDKYSPIIVKISNCIASHMGKWNTNPDYDIVLPLPKTDLEKCVHLCDYLASRKNIEYNFDIEIVND